MMSVDLSVVVLGYQSKEILREFIIQIIGELSEIDDIKYEIVLVVNYNNESDPTLKIAQSITNDFSNINLLSLKKRGGMGWDMRKGLEVAKGDYICVIDGDGQMPASDIAIVYQLIIAGKYDLVKTYRAIRHDGWIRKVMTKTYNLLFNLLFRPEIVINDVNAKPKIFSREVYNRFDLKSDDWFTDAEIMIQAISLKLKISEISTVFYKNERRSSFINFQTVFEFIYNLFYHRFLK